MPLSSRSHLVSNAASECLSSAFRVHVSAPYVAAGITKALKSPIFSFKGSSLYFQIERSELKHAEARTRRRLMSFEEFVAEEELS